MMSTMRKNTATILWILVFAFIATIVFSWGMGGFKGKYEPGVIGKVNGKKITRDMYEYSLENRMEYERQVSDEPLTDNKTKQIRGEVWDAMVNELLVDEYFKKANINVTDKEVSYSVVTSPPPQLMQNPQLQDSLGNFDTTRYKQIIYDPSNVSLVLQLEKNARDQIRQQKIIQRITTNSHISEPEALEKYERDNKKAYISYILSEWKDMPIDSSEVSEADIANEYRNRKEDFKRLESRSVQYVLFPDEPSPEDSNSAKEFALDLYDRINQGADFEELAREYSDDGSASEGGDLGWFGKGKMVDAFADAALAAKVGEVVGPVKSQFGYHIIRVDDRRGKGEDWELKARHILIKIERSPQTLDDLQTRADGFREEATENGFEAAMEVYNLKPDTIDQLSRRGFFPKLGRNQAASELLFNRPEGEISPVYMFRQGLAIMRVISITPEGFKDLDEVRESIQADLYKQQQYEKAKAASEKIYNTLAANSNNLEKTAEANAKTVEAVTRAFKIDDYVSGIGRDYEFTKVIFSMKIGDISSPIKSQKGYTICRLDSMETPDMEKWDEVKETEIYKLKRERQQNVYDAWLATAKSKAKIEDFRYLYYTNY